MVWQEIPTNCELAENHFYDMIDNPTLSGIPDNVADHIHRCSACQKRIEELKQILQSVDSEPHSDPLAQTLESHFTKIGEPLGCPDVIPFLPVMAIPDTAIHIPTPVTVHLDHCKSCEEILRQMQAWKLSDSQYKSLSDFFTSRQNSSDADGLQTLPHLQNIVRAWKEQDSGVVTVFHVKPQEESALPGQAKNQYSDWPIRVEVWNRRENECVAAAAERDPDGGRTPRHRSRVSANAFRQIFKPLLKPAAVAAIFLIAFSVVLRFSTPAQGLDPVYNAMKNVNQIYIARYAPQTSSNPIQEQWLSATAGIHLNKTASEEILQNIVEKTIQSKNIHTGERSSVPMPPDVADHFQKSFLTTVSRLLPFHRLSQAPADAKWELLPPDPAFPHSQVYELTWQESRPAGEPVYRKWRCFVDSAGRLNRAEWHKKLDSQPDYTLDYYTLIEYPSEQDILAQVKNEF